MTVFEIISITLMIIFTVGGGLFSIIVALIIWNVKTTLATMAGAQKRTDKAIEGLSEVLKEIGREKKTDHGLIHKKINDNQEAANKQIKDHQDVVNKKFEAQQSTMNRIEKRIVAIMIHDKIPMSDIDLTRSAYETQI